MYKAEVMEERVADVSALDARGGACPCLSKSEAPVPGHARRAGRLRSAVRPKLWLDALRSTIWMPLAVGAAVGVVSGRAMTKAGGAVSNPNTVVLRGEKRVSLEREGMTLADMADAFAEQTERPFTLDKALANSKTRYSFLLSNVPLASALAATGRLADAAWERHGSGYLLRPLTPEERVSDPERLEDVLNDVEDVLKALPADDESPSSARAGDLQALRRSDHAALRTLPVFSADDAARWRVTLSPNQVTIISPPTGDLGRPRIAGTGWSRTAVGSAGNGGQ